MIFAKRTNGLKSVVAYKGITNLYYGLAAPSLSFIYTFGGMERAIKIPGTNLYLIPKEGKRRR